MCEETLRLVVVKLEWSSVEHTNKHMNRGG